MKADKIEMFMQLAGQKTASEFVTGDEHTRKLGAQLLLSEVLEYCIEGLGIEPEFNGVRITRPNDLSYHASDRSAEKKDMLDGLADVAYTMYWNAVAMGIPLEQAFEMVCDNNLEKFVPVNKQDFSPGTLEQKDWHCGVSVTWPEEVVNVEIVDVQGELFAVGKDKTGKVRKPSTYKSVDLSPLLAA